MLDEINQLVQKENPEAYRGEDEQHRAGYKEPDVTPDLDATPDKVEIADSVSEAEQAISYKQKEQKLNNALK